MIVIARVIGDTTSRRRRHRHRHRHRHRPRRPRRRSMFLASSRRVWRRLVFYLHFAGNSGSKCGGNVTARHVLRRLHIARICT